MKEARGGGRPNGRLVPAVEYLQSQRVRMMMMMKLAEGDRERRRLHRRANQQLGGGGGGRGGPGGAADAPGGGTAALAAARPTDRPQTPDAAPLRRWRIWRAIRRSTCRTASPTPDRRPTSRSSRGRSARWSLLALAKAYQDAAGFHLKRPTKLDT